MRRAGSRGFEHHPDHPRLEPYTMITNPQFDLSWGNCAWLHHEWRPKWVNILFTLLYLYGLAEHRFFLEFCAVSAD